MRDKGFVVSSRGELAQVEVSCVVDSCQSCSARSVCLGPAQSKGLITAKNPLNASPGDEVEVSIPDTKYSQALIVIFGALLGASLAGIGVGCFISSLFSLPSAGISLLGLLLFLAVAGILLFRYFKKKNRKALYPLIVDIIKKGKG